MKKHHTSDPDPKEEPDALRQTLQRTERALKESEDRFRSLSETSLQGLVIVQGDPLRAVYASPPVAAMLGYTIEEILSFSPEKIQSIMYGEDEPVFLKNYRGRLEGKPVPPRYEARVFRKDGKIRWLEVFAGRVQYEGKPAVQAAFVDITERKQAVEVLYASERRYRRIFENVQDIFYQTDKNGNIIDISPSIERYSSYTREELIGKPVAGVYANPADREALLRLVVEKGEVSDYEVRVKAKEGRLIYASVNAHLLLDESGIPAGVEGTLRDITERKISEEALRASEARYRLLFYQSPVGIFQFDRELRVTDCNDQFLALLRAPREKIIGFDMHHLKDPSVIPAICQAVEGKDGYYEGPYESTTSGTQVWVLMKTAPVFGEGGVLNGGIGIVQDMTKSREAAREIVMLAQALKSAKDCISVTDMDDNILFVNGAFSRTYGYSPEELIGKPVRTVRAASNPESIVREILPATLRGGWEGEIFNRRKDGTEFPVFLTTSVVRDQDGSPIALIGAATDITERKRAEEQLRESEERYRSLIDNARDVIFTATPYGVITSLNPAFETILGWKREEWIGKTYNDMFHPEDLAGAREYFLQALSGEPVPIREIRIRSKSGPYYVGEFTITPQRNNDRIVGLLGVGRDVTERKRLEEHYRQAQKMESLGTLAGGIAHDFNNILAIILGHASLLPRHQLNSTKQIASIDSIIKATKRGASLVSQLLTFASKSDVLFESVQINDIVAETIRLLGETFPKTIDVSSRLSESLPPLMADPTQIHQLLLNLCINSRDAMPSGGKLVIGTTLITGDTISAMFANAGASNYVVLQVADTGEGMDQATKRRMFEPFFTTKEKGKGTGLGLATVYGIIERHGGFVDVDTEAGVGTTFHVYFPAQSGPYATLREPVGDVPGGSERILVVEDEEMLRELVKNVLISKGYTVLTAADGIEAVEIYMKHRSEIDLLVADVGLPRLAGSEVFHRLKEANPDLRAILASGFLEPGLKAEILRAGAKDVIPKPYQPNELLRSIRKALDS